MKLYYIVLFLALFGYSFAINAQEQRIISDPTNLLLDDTVSIELEYLLWGCDCPNWVSLTDKLIAQNDSAVKLIDKCIYIRPAKPQQVSPDSTFNFQLEKIIVKGSFYAKEDYPPGTVSQEEPMKKAKIFEFFEIKIISK